MIHRPPGDAPDDRGMDERIADDPFSAHLVAARLELRLDERDDVGSRADDTNDGGQHLCQRDERRIDGGNVDPFRKRLEVADVRALHHHHARVFAQAQVELAIADIDRVDTTGASLEHAVGEAAGRRADIHRDEAGDVDRECFERSVQLLAAATDESGRLRDLDRRIFGDQGAGARLDVAPHAHLAGHDKRARLFAARD